MLIAAEHPKIIAKIVAKTKPIIPKTRPSVAKVFLPVNFFLARIENTIAAIPVRKPPQQHETIETIPHTNEIMLNTFAGPARTSPLSGA